jgi:hypothetical protein
VAVQTQLFEWLTYPVVATAIPLTGNTFDFQSGTVKALWENMFDPLPSGCVGLHQHIGIVCARLSASGIT